MAMPNNLLKRDGTYYARIYIPQDLQPSFDGKKEKWQSLRTKEQGEAKARLAAVLDDWASRFASMRQGINLSGDEVSRAVFNHYSKTVERGDVERTPATEQEIWTAHEKATAERIEKQRQYGVGMHDYTNSMIDVYLLTNKTQIASDQRKRRLARLKLDLGAGDTRLIEIEADKLIRENNFKVLKGSTEYRDLCLGLMRAEIEALTRNSEREAGDFTGTIKDPLIVEPAERPAPTSEQAGDLSIMEAYDRFVKRNPNGIRPETLKQGRRDIQLFADFAGPRVTVDKITGRLVSDFKELLFDYPSRAGLITEFKGLTPQQVVTANATIGKPVMNHKTVNKTLASLSSFCKWLQEDRKILGSNPVAGLMKKPKGVNANNDERVTFTIGQLTALFSSPLFTGVASADKWSEFKVAGDHVIRDHRYWIWLAMLYSGARPAEIAQLYLNDFDVESGIWFMRIADLGERQRVMRDASRRKVPVHSELIRLGFKEYFEATKQAGHTQLFPELELPEEGQIAAQFSRESNRYLTAMGIKKDKTLVTYSLRHTFIDQARIGGFLNEQIALVVGHDESFGPRGIGQTKSYGQLQHGTLKYRKKIVESVRYTGLDLNHLVPRR